MIWRSMASSAAVAAMVALAALAACAQGTMQSTGYEECDFDVTGMAASPEIMTEYVTSLPPAGIRARDILMDATALENAIDTLGGTGANLAAKIQSVRNSAVASGLAGVPVRSFLKAADHTLNGVNFGHPITHFTIEGKVEAYHYVPGGDSCLRVRTTTRAERASGADVTVAYRWTIFGDFQDAPRNNSDSNNVFPTAMTLPISATMAGSFNHKLWARGTMLRVTKVERKTGNAPFVLLPKTNPLYQVTPDSCVDMMFAGTPPATLPPGAAPPFYCLGRCKHPPVINTK